VLTAAGFQVLLAVASGHTHGYAVMRFVEELTGGRVRLGPGTLYRTIARLVADDVVTESETHDPSAPHDVREESEQLARMVDAARTAGLLDPQRRTA